MHVRTMISDNPYSHLDEGRPWPQRGLWPCRWISCPQAGQPPFVTAYRRRFEMDRDAKVRVHVSADERYELFVDGVRVGRGPERGDINNWFYETYDLELAKGAHVVVARVWSLGLLAPYAQMTVRPGFILAPQDDLIGVLGTGVAEWQCKRLGGYGIDEPLGVAWGTGANLTIDAAEFDWGFESGGGEGWAPVAVGHEGTCGRVRNEVQPVHLMRPAVLPAMMEQPRQVGTVRFVSAPADSGTAKVPVRSGDHLADELDGWQGVLAGQPITLAANTIRRAIIDLENYYCAYPELVTSGGKGAKIRVHWAEGLFTEPNGNDKGNRDEIEGKYFYGTGDRFLPDGGKGRRFETLWWQAGRYVEIVVETADEPLTLERLTLRETRYPLANETRFESSDSRMERVTPIAVRALQMCSHETYMDCPYYEQLMYVGDTRLEALTTYAITHDDRLPRKALMMFDASRRHDGLTQSRYPSRVRQTIPPFSLWWVAMIHDYAWWRDDRAFVESLMVGGRNVMEGYRRFVNPDGLLQAPNGWNFTDWVQWEQGIPPHGEFGVSGVLNWQYALVLTQMAELEEYLNEPELAQRCRRQARDLAGRCEAFWDEGRRLYADDLEHKHFSEHTQCLAVLSGLPGDARLTALAESLPKAQDVQRTTVYFIHYLFETCRKLGLTDLLFERLGLWFDFVRSGLKTTPEQPEPTRSDCHAWGAHVLYHYLATILGVRPGAIGFGTVRIEPRLGPLKWARGTIVHPKGMIGLDLHDEEGRTMGCVTLPRGVTGVVVRDGRVEEIGEGKTCLS